MATFVEVPELAQLPARWRAACVILCAVFPRDRAVWARITPGESIDLDGLVRDPDRPAAERVLLAVAQGLAGGDTTVPVDGLVALDDARLRLVLEALAVARGSFPID